MRRLGVVFLGGLSFAWSQPAPVQRIVAAPPAISFSSFRFQEIRFGREGPMYIRMQGEPYAGASTISEALLSGQQSIGTIRFEIVDEAGAPLQAIPAMKKDNSLDWGEYLAVVVVPRQPFRVAASGQDVDGAPYRCVFPRLFRPREGSPGPPPLPPEVPPDYADRLRQLMNVFEQQTRSRIQASPAPLVLPRIHVSGMTHEPFYSPAGNLLGIRFRYNVQFSLEGAYTVLPHAFPVYRGSAGMKVYGGTIEPKPEVASDRELDDIILYGAPGRYKAGTSYRFSVDTVPGYIAFNTVGPRQPCIQGTVVADSSPRPYQANISSADFAGRLEPAYPQKIFYDSFLQEGILPCSSPVAPPLTPRVAEPRP